jgi:hypothetical protein
MRSPKRIDASPTLYHILPNFISGILLKIKCFMFIDKDISIAIPIPLKKQIFFTNKSGVNRLIID